MLVKASWITGAWIGAAIRKTYPKKFKFAFLIIAYRATKGKYDMAQASPIFHFLKEDTKRHRKTLWKSGSITIATKKKIQRPSQGNLRRLSLCPEGGGSLCHTSPSALVPIPAARAWPPGAIVRNTRKSSRRITINTSATRPASGAMAAHGSGFVTAISQPTHCASNAGGPVRSPLPRKSTISCLYPRAALMWKATLWPYASGAILRSPPAKVAGGAENLLKNKANRACNHTVFR